jgi:urease subunit gamma/beta
MRLTDWEEERLLLFTAAELARRNLARGVLLNQPEAVALICDAMLQAAREGGTYGEVEAAGRAAVAVADVMPGVAELVDEVRVEVLMRDGTRLVVLTDPLGRGAAGTDANGPGAAISAPSDAIHGAAEGGTRIRVRNTSQRVVRVSSHYPFEQVNARLDFDRAAATGLHLDLAAGSTERWAPGETREVTLVPYPRAPA